MAKETYDFESKRKVRENFSKFIKRYLGHKIKDLKVACLPGEEALEIFEVYDPLGIPRENIWGIERGEKEYNRLQSKNLGIHLFPGDDVDFLMQTEHKFDVINLDYQGMFGTPAFRSLKAIARRQILQDKGILGTTFFANREKEKTQLSYQVGASVSKGIYEQWEEYLENADSVHSLENYDPYDEKQKEKQNELIKMEINRRSTKNFLRWSEMNLEDIRDIAITGYIAGLMRNGRYGYGVSDWPNIDHEVSIPPFVPKLIKINPNYDEINKQWLKESNEGMKKFLDSIVDDFLKLRKKHPEKADEIDARLSEVSRAIEIQREREKEDSDSSVFRVIQLTHRHTADIEKQIGKDKAAHLFVHLISETGYYFPLEIRKYSYENDAGNIMYADHFYFSQERSLIDSLKKFSSFKVVDGKMLCDAHVPPSLNYSRAVKEYERNYNLLVKLVDSKIENLPRIFLGSSYKPKAPKEEVARMLISGASDKEIKEKFRIKKMELAGIKAALSKGSYEDLRKAHEERKRQNEPTQNKESEKIELKKGILIFDSNPSRLHKNISKSNFLENRVDSTSVLHGVQKDGFLSRTNTYDLYVLNSSDLKSDEAFSDLALRYCESNRYLNLLLIGPKSSLEEQIGAARDLGAKIRVGRYETDNGYINPDHPLDLKGVWSSMLVNQKVKKREMPERKIKKPEANLSEQNKQEICEAIKSGFPDEKIMTKFNLSKQQLAGKKASLTRKKSAPIQADTKKRSFTMPTITRKVLLYPSSVEYADYCINHVLGCSHGCNFPCYAFNMSKTYGRIKTYEEWRTPKLVSNALEILDKEIPKLKDKMGSVHLCFTTDPFMHGYPEVTQMSLDIIKKLNSNGIKCTTLTKGVTPEELAGEEFSKENEPGITLVSLNEYFRTRFEPFAAPYKDRIAPLRKLSEKGLRTWASIEPYPTPNIVEQDLENILYSLSFANKLIFGRLNYNPLVTQFEEREEFYKRCIDIFRSFCEKKGIERHVMEVKKKPSK